MDAHRRLLHRRQAYSGDPFATTPATSTKKPNSTTTSSLSTSNVKLSTSTTSPTSSTPTSTPSSTPSSSRSSSSPSAVTSLVPAVATSIPTSTSIRSTPTSTSTSYTRTSLTSLTPTPSATGNSGNSSNSGANVSTGAVVGGIAAAILGIGGIIFAILYFIRRLKRKGDDNFDSDVLRRQSRMLPDEPQVLSDGHSPFSPRPPTMIERRMNSTPVSNMGSINYGSGPAYGGYNDYNAGYNHPGFVPGQVIPHHPFADSGMPDSPLPPTPMSPPMSVNHRDLGAEQPQSAYLSRQPSTNGPPPADNAAQYVDMSRSSVTPFQAAQYEEIHRRLNIPAPEPVLGSLAEEEYPKQEPIPQGPSPFADPSEDVLPPPSPVHSNRSRVDSSPPKLPELNPPMSPVYALHPVPLEFPTKQTEAPTADLPATPAPAHVVHPTPAPARGRPDTVYTIYDDEDAYGGI